MNKSELKELIKEEVSKILKEENTTISPQIADKFIKDVLKLGSKENLFDKFMATEGIHRDELSNLVCLVADQLKTWC